MSFSQFEEITGMILYSINPPDLALDVILSVIWVRIAKI